MLAKENRSLLLFARERKTKNRVKYSPDARGVSPIARLIDNDVDAIAVFLY